jgi:integrase
MRGNITRRGKNSWRIKFDDGADASGKRITRYITVKGKRQDAQRELTKLLGAADAGTLVEPSKVTVAEYLRQWLNGNHGLSPNSAARYWELADGQIIPHLGGRVMQQLRPGDVEAWHDILLKCGAKNGKPLSPRTIGHAHRVLHRALQRAVESETLSRNVASVKPPPTVDAEEVEILDADQIRAVVEKLARLNHRLHDIVALDVVTGLRRGEILALRLSDVDLEKAMLRVERSLEFTQAGGLRFKAPKTKHGKRTISLPTSAVELLRGRRLKLLEERMALGLGKPDGETLLFGKPDGSPMRPTQLSALWQYACKSLKLPMVKFHALRHTHASALIADGLDIVLISRRLGHANPTITLNVYGHLFKRDDRKAADAMQALALF